MPVPESAGPLDLPPPPPGAPPPGGAAPAAGAAPGGAAVVRRVERLTGTEVDAVMALVRAAERADGAPPVSEQGLLRLRAGAAGQEHLLAHEHGRLVGYGSLAAAVAEPAGDPAGRSREGSAEVGAPRRPPLVGELVVAPGARGRGTGRALVEAALAARGTRVLQLWMHGDTPAARSLAQRSGLRRVRDLATMRADLGPGLPPLPEVPGVRVRAFRPGQDEDAWLRVNARAFAEHPEQGAWTHDDLLARMREPWFDADGLLLVEDTTSGEVLASHWTKTTTAPDGSTPGEVYVVAVDPSAQGRGLGRLVTLAGLHHLRDRGVRAVDLYVESDNAPAVATYRRLGFERSGGDVLVEADAPSAAGPSDGGR